MVVKTEPNFEIQTKSVEISHERMKDVLTSSMEGGYARNWCSVDSIVPPKGKTLNDFKGEGKYPLYDVPFVEGGKVLFDVDDEGIKELNLETMQKGLQMMANDENLRRHFDDIVNENDDADTSDVWLQMSLLGEIIFG